MKSCFFRSALLTAMIFLALHGQCQSQEYKSGKNPWLIIPGKSVGWVKIGFNDIRTIEKHFGKTGQWMKEDGALSYRKGYGLDFIYDKSSMTVTSVIVSVNSSGGVRYITDKGIHVDGPFSQVEKIYGKAPITDKVKEFDVSAYKLKEGFILFARFKERVVLIWTGIGSDYEKHGPRVREIIEKMK